MRLSQLQNRRTGTILPLLALALMGLLGMVALAIDIGLIAVARTQVQGAADIAALTGARLLTGDSSETYNISGSNSSAVTAATYNKILGTSVATSEVAIRTGQYKYDSSLQRFNPNASSYTTSSSAAPPNGTGAWTCSEATITSSQPTFFARVLGINSFSVGATATAVHRPRDVALILDFSGSMKFSSVANYDTGGGDGVRSLNPDPIWPKFGHWSRYVGLATTGANAMQRTTDFTMSSGENAAPNNYTSETDNGPAIVGSAASTNYVTLSSGSYVPAFYNPQSGAYSSTYSPCATPAPDDFETQSSATATYVGDLAPRINQVATNAYAKTVQEVRNLDVTTYAANNHIRDDSWEQNGYGANFKGYSMGPGYYGKTFWQWPPDPRYGTWVQSGTSAVYYYDRTASSTALNTANPVKDTSNRWLADWRCRFFYYGSSATNSGGTNISGQRVDDNNVLFDSSGQLRSPSSSGYQIDYPAILAWIKTGPVVFPPNLRSGRVLYYSAIPDVVTSGTNLDQVFWKNYIDFVLGIKGRDGTLATSFDVFHGKENTNWGTGKITSKYNLVSTGSRSNTNKPAPYMQYEDNPKRPRAHFWFGPYTMAMFIGDATCNPDNTNMAPGTCTEAQCWQLKAGIQSAIDDVKKNHPNDWLAMIFFSDKSTFNTARVQLSQDYTKMKNSLWYPFTLLNVLSDTTQELRAIDSGHNWQLGGNVPHAEGATCPDMGFKLAYNEFSTANGYNGRKGAAKMVILETDGVPNTTCGGTLNSGGAYQALYTSTTNIGTTSYVGNGASSVLTAALNTVTQICKPDDASNRGYSSTRTPARVHVIAFGDLFESSASMKPTALQFLANVQINGKTQAAGATSPESYKIIVGNYNTRIDNLRTAFERIMQSGVQVTLIK